MLFTCVICAEIINHSDDAHATLCGHIFHFICLFQWLERSKTCPQCRNACNLQNLRRIYFNTANLDASENNFALLQEQLDNANLKNKVCNKELEEAKNEVQSLKKIQKKTVKTISKLEKKVLQYESMIDSYNEMVKGLKIENMVVEEQKKEITELKQKLELMSTVQIILEGNGPDVESLLKSENNPKVLGVWVTTLRKELKQSENKKSDLRKSLQAMQNDLKKVQEEKSILEEKVISLESENYKLSEKIKVLENPNKCDSFSEIKSSLNKLTITLDNDLKNNSTNNLNTISPKTSERIKKIEESNSPYLNIKSSGIGLKVLEKFKEKSIDNSESSNGSLKRNTSDLSEKYNIFKKPRLQVTLNKQQNSDLVFDGFGSSERKEFLFNLNRNKFTLSERVKNGKLKKLPN